MKALSLNQKNVNAMIVLGTAKIAQQKFSESLTYFTNALALQPALKPALLLRAQAYFKLNEFQKAKADLDFAIKNDPKNLEAYLYRARFYATEKDFAGAIADYIFIRDNGLVGSKPHETATK